LKRARGNKGLVDQPPYILELKGQIAVPLVNLKPHYDSYQYVALVIERISLPDSNLPKKHSILKADDGGKLLGEVMSRDIVDV
jgi:hypothetical protein